MNEAEVVARVRAFLQSAALPDASAVQHLFTDAHPTLIDRGDLRPYQRVRLDLGSRAVHPDLVARLNDGERLLAVEAKGAGDLLKGTTQAELYQAGFQYSLLAAPVDRIGSTLESLARRKNIGLLAVGDDVTPIAWPRARQPWQDVYQSVRRQLDTGVRAQAWSTFPYNLPTHYLAWTLALEPGGTYNRDRIREAIASYDAMPKDEQAALRGAATLGLVAIRGDAARLTSTGAAVGRIIDLSPAAWSRVHRRAIHSTLADVAPRAAAALRIVLHQEPMIRLVVRGLRELDGRRGSMPELVRACDALDHDRTPVLFFHPERVAAITTADDRIRWTDVEGIHFRSTTHYQAKSILKHAGILEDTGLGAASAKEYVPEEDIWALRG